MLGKGKRKRKREESGIIPISKKKRKVEKGLTNEEVGLSLMISGRYFHERNPKKALRHYNLSIILNPLNFETYLFIGKLYQFKLNSKKMALENYNISTKINPKNFYSYMLLGNLYKELKNFKKARHNYLNFIDLAPDDSMGYYSLGMFYFDNLKNFELGILNLTKAINRAKDNNQKKNFYAYRGKIFESKKNLKLLAISDYDNSIKYGNRSLLIFYRRGLLNFKIKNFEKSIKDFSFFINKNPKIIKLYLWRAKAYCNCKQYNRAINDFSIAIKLKSNYYIPYYERGKVYEFFIKDYSCALMDYYIANKYMPNKQPILDSISYLIESQFKDKSKNIFEVVNKIDKNNIVIFQKKNEN